MTNEKLERAIQMLDLINLTESRILSLQKVLDLSNQKPDDTIQVGNSWVPPYIGRKCLSFAISGLEFDLKNLKHAFSLL